MIALTRAGDWQDRWDSNSGDEGHWDAAVSAVGRTVPELCEVPEMSREARNRNYG